MTTFSKKLFFLTSFTLFLTPVFSGPGVATNKTKVVEASSNVVAEPQKPAISENIVAKLNEESITLNMLERAVDVLVPRNFIHGSVTAKKRDKLKKEALDKLIEQRLMIQHAKNIGIKVSAEELQQEETNIARNIEGKEAFLEALTKARFTSYDEFKTALEGDLILKKFYHQEVKTVINDVELKDYYEKNKFKFKEPEKIKIKIIYMRRNPNDPEGDAAATAKAYAKAKAAYDKVMAGADFGDIAAKYSDAMSSIKGGDVGYTHRGRFDPVVDDAAFSLNKGEISNIVENTKGYYIVYLEDKKPQNLIPFERTKEKLRKQLITNREEEIRETLYQKLKQAAKIEIFQTFE